MASTSRNPKKGVSLAKGPVALLGAVMLAYGIIAFLLGGSSFTASPPSGDVSGDTFFGIEGNGWTNVLWAAGGALLLFGSPFHWGAKTIALIVGLALGAASVIAMFDGWSAGDVLGIFATNNWTILALGAASAYLLITALLPRVGKRHDREVVEEDRGRRHDHDHDHDHDRDREYDRGYERGLEEGRVHRAEHAERAEPVREDREHVRDRDVVAPASDNRHTEVVADREGEGRFDRGTGRDDPAGTDAERTRGTRGDRLR